MERAHIIVLYFNKISVYCHIVSVMLITLSLKSSKGNREEIAEMGGN